jgi:hypothetical protein
MRHAKLFWSLSPSPNTIRLAEQPDPAATLTKISKGDSVSSTPSFGGYIDASRLIVITRARMLSAEPKDRPKEEDRMQSN